MKHIRISYDGASDMQLETLIKAFLEQTGFEMTAQNTTGVGSIIVMDFSQVHDFTNTEVGAAIAVLTKVMKEKPDYAERWHTNIATMCYGAIQDYAGHAMSKDGSNSISNTAAKQFMKDMFDVETGDE